MTSLASSGLRLVNKGRKNIGKFVKMWSKVTTSYKKFNIVYDVGQKNGMMSEVKDMTS